MDDRQIGALLGRIVTAEREVADQRAWLNSLAIQIASGTNPWTIAARATTAAGQIIPNNAATIVNFATVDLDTHGAVTPGTAWAFTAPAAGVYRVSSGTLFQPVSAWGGGERAELRLYRSGARWSYLDYQVYPGGTFSLNTWAHGTDLVSMSAGNQINIQVYQNSGTAIALLTDRLFNYVAIERI